MDPRNPSSSGSVLLDKMLSKISDFKRSLNLSVMLDDRSLREAYAAALTDGQLPANRARVLILGEPRAGKTSLLNRLLGKQFDIQEEPTEGIETRMCHVTNVDKQWNESDPAKADDIRECASAVTVLGETSSAGGEADTDSNSNPTNSTAASEASATVGYADLIKLALQLLFVTVPVLALGTFQYGYAVFVWCTVGAISLMRDYIFAYRFATTISLACVLADITIRNDQSGDGLVCEEGDDSFRNKTIWSTIESIVFNTVYSAMVGAAVGFGCRTGIAVIFSACVHPAETEWTWDAVVRNLEASLGRLVPTGICGAGAFIGFVCYTYCTVNDTWHKRRTAVCCGFIALLLALHLEVACRHRHYYSVFLNGLLMSIGGTWGTLFGRRTSHTYGLKANYVTKKTLGVLFGLYLTHVCGWTPRIPKACLPSLAFCVLSVAAHPLFDLHVTYRVWRVKSVFPVKVIRDQMRAVGLGRPLLETKLSVWDFAGDTLYHCAHHVFMPDRAVYVIVFNLEAAVSDTDGQLQKLLFWLHSVCAHARHPDAVIMIVGTHKAGVSEANRLRLSDELHRRITSSFCHRLVLNPVDDKPLFLVENSQPLDRDFQQLRAEIYRRIESAQYAQERYSIKYLHFYREIQNRRKLAETDHAENVMTLKEVRDLARETCDVTDEDDLKKMLQFFGEAGEIIHKDDDEVLRQHVVLDPQFLVDVMKKLVRIPRGAKRSHRFAVDWRDYESTGIITEDLLRHIYEDMSTPIVPLLISFLEAHNLMCAIAPSVKKSFLVPSMLPPYLGDPVKFWKPTRKEEVFYFDFGLFDPRTVYYRLLTRCLTQAFSDKTNPSSRPVIFADRCRFNIGTSFILKLQLERSPRQMLLSVTVLPFESKPSTGVLEELVDFVKRIAARDYPHICFTFGPRCPFCLHDDKQNPPSEDLAGGSDDLTGASKGDRYPDKPTIHVLKMTGHDQPFPTKSSVVMFCGQERYELKLSGRKATDGSCGSSSLPLRVSFGPETPITKLPPDLFERVCVLLNLPSFTGNWKTLAGELGKDVQSVAVLSSDRVTNPTECLLREWAMTSGEVTVNDLLEVLGRPSLQRMDIIQEIRAQMTQAYS